MGAEGDTGAVGSKGELDGTQHTWALHPNVLVDGEWFACTQPERTIGPGCGAVFDSHCKKCMIAAQAFLVICGDVVGHVGLEKSGWAVDKNDPIAEHLSHLVGSAVERGLIPPTPANPLHRPSP